MSKGALVEAMLAQKGRNAPASKAEAERAIDSVFAGVESVTNAGDRVTIVGFGTFQKKHVSERNTRNPRTGESVRVAAKDVLKFKAAKAR